MSIERKTGKRTFVGLSGGVDSAVSAALLKRDGYQVIGVFIRGWEPLDSVQGKLPGVCDWREERRDAMRVAARLDIPFRTLDLSREYKEEVVDYLIAEYRAGRTPNPDVVCNRQIKFGHFFRLAKAQGADFIATGHYAGIKKQTTDWPSSGHNGKVETRSMVCLVPSKDKEKDQTYFLWAVNQEVLQQTLFPVGNLTKPEVRRLAAKFGLPIAAKKDSQGICFVGQLDLKDFLRQYIPVLKGDVLNQAGAVIGEHDGAALITLGERHGFRIFKQTPNKPPYYVISKDIEKNTITVSHGKVSPAKGNKGAILREVNWICGKVPDPNKTYGARVRYRQDLADCHIKTEEGRIKVSFLKPQILALGQSCVIYDGQECLGGGIIN